MGDILLIRHAESELHGRFCGSFDPGLSECGREEARQLAEKLRAFDIRHVYCSPQRRALMTADTIMPAAASVTFSVVDDLREIGFGAWEGLTWEQIERLDAEYANRWIDQFPNLPAPGGEAFEPFEQRVQSAWREIQACTMRESAGAIAVIAHGGVLRVILAHHLLQPFRDVPTPGTASFTVIHC